MYCGIKTTVTSVTNSHGDVVQIEVLDQFISDLTQEMKQDVYLSQLFAQDSYFKLQA